MDQHSEVTSSVVVAVIVTELIEILKRAGWCPLGYDTDKLNRVVGAACAFLTGIGLQFQFDAVTGRLVIDGLLATGLLHGVAQWATQMAYYRLAVKPLVKAEPAKPLITEE